MPMTLLASVRNALVGENVLVIGDGESSRALVPDQLALIADRHTIVCNRAALRLPADFVVCVEKPDDPIWGEGLLTLDRPMFVREGAPEVPHGIVLPRHFKVSRWPGFDDLPGLHPQVHMSPYWGAALAAYMGAGVVGILGVDLYGHPRFDRPKVLTQCQTDWRQLASALSGIGCRLLNLSPTGALSFLPGASLADLRPKSTPADQA